jgi:hypothetical protein
MPCLVPAPLRAPPIHGRPFAPRVRRGRARKVQCAGRHRRPRPGRSLPGRRSCTRAATVLAPAPGPSGEPSRAAPSMRRRSGRRSCTAPHRRGGTCSNASVPLVPRRRPSSPPRRRTSTQASGKPALIPAVRTRASIASPGRLAIISPSPRPATGCSGSMSRVYELRHSDRLDRVVDRSQRARRRKQLARSQERHAAASKYPARRSLSIEQMALHDEFFGRDGAAAGWSAGSPAAGRQRSSFPARSTRSLP